jgi:phosphopantetheinyl transferase
VTVAWAWAEKTGDSRRRVVERACAALGVPVVGEVAHLCPRCGSGDHGRPYAPGRDDVALSLARSAGVVAAAVGTGVGVGIDVERLDGTRFSGLGGTVLHEAESVPSEHALALTWTRKEAVLKALGVGLTVDPREVRLDASVAGARVLSLPTGYDASRVRLLDLALPSGLVGALAVLVDRPDREVSVVAAGAGPARAARPGPAR